MCKYLDYPKEITDRRFGYFRLGAIGRREWEIGGNMVIVGVANIVGV